MSEVKKTFNDVVCFVDEISGPHKTAWIMELYDGTRWRLHGVKGYAWLRSVDCEEERSVGMDGRLTEEAGRERIFMELLHRHPDSKLYGHDDDVMRLVTSLRPIIGSLTSDAPGVQKRLAEVRRNLRAFDGRWEDL